MSQEEFGRRDLNRRDAEAQRINEITGQIIGAAIEVHRELGPGLLESAYHQCLCHELNLRGLRFEYKLPLPVRYKGIDLDCGYEMDLVVEDAVIVELKTVAKIIPVHEAQLLTYLKLYDRRVGLLINFYVSVLKEGIKRIVNDFPESSASLRLGGST
ncbi:MAG: GxxExxY protein [Pirellulales bacterium]